MDDTFRPYKKEVVTAGRLKAVEFSGLPIQRCPEAGAVVRWTLLARICGPAVSVGGGIP
jgi:hypothetical protein